MMIRRWLPTVLILLVVATALVSCIKDKTFTSSGNEVLTFSTDTLVFDTIFTERGSATRSMKLYNSSSDWLKINSIRVKSGAQSKFRLNVDGIAASQFTDVEIPPNDSIYLFAEVTIDPDEPLSLSPFVIGDVLEFEVNDEVATVVIEAWGQNANYIPGRFSAGTFPVLSCDLQEVTWDDPKPYVIYGFLLIDSCTLRLPAGARIHVHGGLAQLDNGDGTGIIYNDGVLLTLSSGRIISEGTADNPVVIEGDRLEDAFKEEPGQWVGIRLQSRGNSFTHTIIKNGILGIQVDSAASAILNNVQIYNTSSVGLVGFHSEIIANNTLIYNNGGACAQLTYGGSYRFNYCTLASYGVDASALSISNGYCEDPLCSTGVFVNGLNAQFRNSIFFGSRRDEVSIVDFTGGQDPSSLVYQFSRCVVKVDELDDANAFPDFFDRCDCINGTNQDALFVDPNEDLYQLDTLSIAEQQATPLPSIDRDLVGNVRDGSMPDIGCFEYVD